MSNYKEILPRAELKFRAKQKLRGNWKPALAITLLFLVAVSIFAGSEYATAPNENELMFLNASSVVGLLGLSMGISFIAGLLIDGILAFCYTAWFVKLANSAEGTTLTFSDFVENFSEAIRAMLAYLWQSLWSFLWSLLVVPGYIVLAVGAFQESIAIILLGIVVMLIGLVAAIIRVLRYTFIFYVLADGQGKIGVRQALRHSITMTEGYVGAIFVLALSFIPWFLLAIPTIGLILFYLVPYMAATYAMVYVWLRDKAFNEGRLSPAAFGYAHVDAQAEVKEEVLKDTTTENEAPVAEVVDDNSNGVQ